MWRIIGEPMNQEMGNNLAEMSGKVFSEMIKNGEDAIIHDSSYAI